MSSTVMSIFSGQRKPDAGAADGRSDEGQYRHGEGYGEKNEAEVGGTGVAGEAAGNEASDAAGKQHGEDDDGESVGGVAQEEDELLNQGDLDQDIAGADEDEVPQEAAYARARGQPGSEQKRGQREDHEGGEQADADQAEQQRQGAVDFGIGRYADALAEERPDVAGLHGVEEERAGRR